MTTPKIKEAVEALREAVGTLDRRKGGPYTRAKAATQLIDRALALLAPEPEGRCGLEGCPWPTLPDAAVHQQFGSGFCHTAGCCHPWQPEPSPAAEPEGKHWRCVYCGWRVYSPEIELATQRCNCGVGKGRWGVYRNDEPEDVRAEVCFHCGHNAPRPPEPSEPSEPTRELKPRYCGHLLKGGKVLCAVREDAHTNFEHPFTALRLPAEPQGGREFVLFRDSLGVHRVSACEPEWARRNPEQWIGEEARIVREVERLHVTEPQPVATWQPVSLPTAKGVK